MLSKTMGSGVNAVDDATMRRVYEAAATPHKVGIVIRGDLPDELVDCASVFRFDGRWYMLYAASIREVGYQTCLAVSDDLLHWEKRGVALPYAGSPHWDAWQADGGIALVDPIWGGTAAPATFHGKYWMSYLGGDQQGYEPDPLSIGLAHSGDPTRTGGWTRVAGNPVLTPTQADTRDFEGLTLYKSQIIHDPDLTLGHPFVMFYNGKMRPLCEWIGIAVSDDMIHWKRYGDGPVVGHVGKDGRGISGDPQLVRMGGVWVMFFFAAHWGAPWPSGAFDTFACSYDLAHWRIWDGQPLVASSEPFDRKYAHKPWIVNWNGVTYHFYCAVGDEGRVLALATSVEKKLTPP